MKDYSIEAGFSPSTASGNKLALAKTYYKFWLKPNKKQNYNIGL
ncbi:hypothetical protein [Chryseobacterium sp. GP-SGM7]